MISGDSLQSSCGEPIDYRVVEKLSGRYPLHENYVGLMSFCHGGEPPNIAIAVGHRTVRVAKFLTLLDKNSVLCSPMQPHFEHFDTDERVIDSIDFLLNWEHSTSNALFSGLVPFAATKAKSCLDRCDIDLFCLDYRKPNQAPEVVLWVASRALEHLVEREKLPIDKQFCGDKPINVDWESFLEPIATSFERFIELCYECH